MTAMKSLLRRNRMERLAVCIAFAALFLVILVQGKPRQVPDDLGDFKLVYASASGLLRSGDAYGYGELSRAFHAAGVAQPPDWYGRNPVYPFFTLFTLSPLLLLGMVPAAYLWGTMGYLIVALTALRLAGYAERRYALALPWRLAIITVIAASPLVSFALEVANLSVPCACLCIFVVTAKPEESTWLHVAALVLALLIKPHIALWIVVALFLRRAGRERTIASRASGLFLVSVAVMATYLAYRHQLVPVMTSYSDMLHSEAAGGSMDFRNHQNFLVPAQITALGMLLGYWLKSLDSIAILEVLVLPLLGLSLAWASLRNLSRRADLLASAWIAFGLVATYHRAHDGIALLLVLPWGMARLRRCWHDGPALIILSLYALLSLNVPGQWWQSLATLHLLRPLANLLYDRQAATAAFLLCVSLTVFTVRIAHRSSQN